MKYPSCNYPTILMRPIDDNWVPYEELSKEDRHQLKRELRDKYEEKRKADLYDAMALLRDYKNYLQLTDETDLDLMNKMWEITNKREFRKERRRVFPKGTKSIWS